MMHSCFGLAAIDGVGVLDSRPMYAVLEGKTPQEAKPAHEAILGLARSIVELDMRTADQAPALLGNLTIQVIVRFDDIVPADVVPEMARLVMQAGMATKANMDSVQLAYVIRLIGIEGTAALAEELGFRLVWLGRKEDDERPEALALMTQELYDAAIADVESEYSLRDAVVPDAVGCDAR